jgi:hypothetical protein
MNVENTKRNNICTNVETQGVKNTTKEKVKTRKREMQTL